MSQSSDASAPGARQLRWTLIAGVFALFLAYSSISLFRAPPARGEDVPLQEFSAARAAHHLEIIAQTPHPGLSAENQRVRDYLLEQLRALGFEPTVDQRTVAPWKNSPPVEVQNVLARRAGTASTQALLMCVHYDSAARAPGAGDDGAAVAALLETLRALKQQPPLKNDLIVLFSDGEERGLLGARAFAQEHPWMKDVGLVCNFDARGDRGPSIMFETSANNAGLIDEFARAVPHIIATSLSTAIYKRMPNGTDFTVFRKAGIQGLNFAFIGGVENYHQPSDTLANLSRDTLQHTGEIMVHLIAHFGNRSLPVPSTGDAVYFDAIGSWFIHYPESWAAPMAATLLLAAVVLIWIHLRRGVKTRGLAIAMVAQVLSAILGAAMSVVLLLVQPSRGKFVLVPNWVCFAALGIALVIGLGGARLTTRWVRPIEQSVASLVLWTALALLMSFRLHGGSYLFFWPALFGWIGHALWLAATRSRPLPQLYSALGYATLLAGCWAGIILASPLLAVLWSALPMALPAIVFLSALFSSPLLAAGVSKIRRS